MLNGVAPERSKDFGIKSLFFCHHPETLRRIPGSENILYLWKVKYLKEATAVKGRFSVIQTQTCDQAHYWLFGTFMFFHP